MLTHALRSIADELPFHLDDMDAANATFARWHRDRTTPDRHLVEVWTYCYVYRYFLVKFATSPRRHDGTLDQLVGRAFRDVLRNLDDVRHPDRYTHWVSKVCKNTFVNYLRAQRSYVSLTDGTVILHTSEPRADAAYDLAFIYHVALRAIDALPDYLRGIARMRLIEERSYREMKEQTGHSIPTLRAYVNKALCRLRTHPELSILVDEFID